MPRLFCFGLGYTARRLARELLAEGWTVAGTSRTEESRAEREAEGFDAWVLSSTHALEGLERHVGDANVWLISAPPDVGISDPVIHHHAEGLARCTPPESIIYLSTTGVYPDSDGAWIDEDSPATNQLERAQRRVDAETGWRLFGEQIDVPVTVLRLGGIYGPGRSMLDKARAGALRRIVKPGKVFNRVHVDDVVAAIRAAIRVRPLGPINVVDGSPQTPQAVVEEACRLIGVEPPPEEPWDEIDMSPMMRSFYEGNVRVRSKRLGPELGVQPRYLDAIVGLRAIHEEERTPQT